MKKIYKIQVGKITREEAEKTIAEMMHEFSDDYVWDGKKFTSPTLKRKDRKKKLDRIFNDNLQNR